MYFVQIKLTFDFFFHVKGTFYLNEPTCKKLEEATDDKPSTKEITLNILLNDKIITNNKVDHASNCITTLKIILWTIIIFSQPIEKRWLFTSVRSPQMI